MIDSNMHTNSDFDPKTVFLISGQEAVNKVGNRRGSSPSITQRVVIAGDAGQAMRKLSQKEPEFKSLGVASLEDYETTAQRIRAALSGANTEWTVYVN